MPVLVLPDSLSQRCGLPRELAARGATVGQLLMDAAAGHPSLGRQLFDEAGRLRGYLTVFVNDADAKAAGGLAAPVGEEDVVTILPPVAGGAPARIPLDLAAILQHAEAEYPNEACGLVLEGPGALRVAPMANAADDPKLHFAIAPETLLRELARARAAGEKLAFIYHSHADRSAALSGEDERLALLDGQPAWPGVGWIVVSVERGRAREAQLHTWREGRFEGEELALGRR